MENKWTEEQIIDYIAGELPEAEVKALAEDLRTLPELQSQYEELSGLLGTLSQLPDRAPGDEMQKRFDRMLAAAKAGEARVLTLSLKTWLPRIAAAVALLIVGAGIGWQLSRSNQQAEQLARLQAELEETKSVMLQLVQNDRTSSRIKAVNLTQQLGEPDPEIIAGLDHLLKNDESPNVRLAAIDALVKFSRAPEARQSLKEALLVQDRPVVQIALIHALIRIDDQSALPYLDQLIERDDVLDKVKDEARLGRFRL
jgi:hypothetical protein